MMSPWRKSIRWPKSKWETRKGLFWMWHVAIIWRPSKKGSRRTSQTEDTVHVRPWHGKELAEFESVWVEQSEESGPGHLNSSAHAASSKGSQWAWGECIPVTMQSTDWRGRRAPSEEAQVAQAGKDGLGDRGRGTEVIAWRYFGGRLDSSHRVDGVSAWHLQW